MHVSPGFVEKVPERGVGESVGDKIPSTFDGSLDELNAAVFFELLYALFFNTLHLEKGITGGADEYESDLGAEEGDVCMQKSLGVEFR